MSFTTLNFNQWINEWISDGGAYHTPPGAVPLESHPTGCFGGLFRMIMVLLFGHVTSWKYKGGKFTNKSNGNMGIFLLARSLLPRVATMHSGMYSLALFRGYHGYEDSQIFLVLIWKIFTEYFDKSSKCWFFQRACLKSKWFEIIIFVYC